MHGGSRRYPIASLRQLLESPDCDSPALAVVCHTSGSATTWAVGALFLILIGGALGAPQTLCLCLRSPHPSTAAVLVRFIDAMQATGPVAEGVVGPQQIGRVCSSKPSCVRAAGVGLPLLSKRVRWFATDSAAFAVGRAFAAGVVLATGFVHLFPDAYENLTDPCLGWGGAENGLDLVPTSHGTAFASILLPPEQVQPDGLCAHGCACHMLTY